MLAGLLSLSLTGAEQIRQVNVGLTHKLQDYTVPLNAVRDFVAKHRHEPDFSFAIDYDESDPIPIEWRVPITKTVFGRWMHTSTPKYWVVIRGGKVLKRRQLEARP